LNEIISFQNVSFTYEFAKQASLSDITLSIKKGEFVLLMGTSGSGKSTLCQAMNGVIPHVAPGRLKGKVTVMGEDTSTRDPSYLSKRVAMVFQDPEIQLFSLVVEDEVAMSLENRAVPRDQMEKLVDWALDVTGLTPLRLSSTLALSGGQKQRLATAAALASGAEIIILDEPTAYLDNEGTHAILNVVRRLCIDEGKTVILVEHKPEQTLEFADRVVLMSEGKIVGDGDPREVFSNGALIQNVGVRVPVAVELANQLGKSGLDFPLTLAELRQIIPEESLRLAVQSRLPFSPEVHGEPIIECENLSFAYFKGKSIIDGVSLKIDKGDFVSILGRNGSGKSTLAALLMGLLKPSGGRILVSGADTRTSTVAQMARRVGFLMQNPDHQLFTESVRAEIAFGPKSVGASPMEVDSLVSRSLELIQMSGHEDQHPNDLSMGQRLRLALACALVLSPPILLLDEPTIGQDLSHLTPLMNQIDGLNRNGVTVVMITHDSHLASLHSKRTVLLDEGRVVADAPTAEVLGNEEMTSRCGIDAAPLLRLLADTKRAKRAEVRTQ
jgi:energy-coupling factor transport system ATP-binding protein